MTDAPLAHDFTTTGNFPTPMGRRQIWVEQLPDEALFDRDFLGALDPELATVYEDAVVFRFENGTASFDLGVINEAEGLFKGRLRDWQPKYTWLTLAPPTLDAQTREYQNIAYRVDTLRRHRLDGGLSRDDACWLFDFERDLGEGLH